MGRNQFKIQNSKLKNFCLLPDTQYFDFAQYKCPMPNPQFESIKQYFDNLRYDATHLLIISCHVLMTND
ncbi:hypothetical protein COO91_08977 [Nostoc flagelliforme CCNUN1]|uniref:Uncharacterized protein n=1 Tax=Nostoc flagelliforme CCNUN1 TaxID=2038116 RepID=A0A2K8T599_9NOSO|nr:hypothetical protein COO91_08977 [Nostoc flagelliforme CCNUN1]